MATNFLNFIVVLSLSIFVACSAAKKSEADLIKELKERAEKFDARVLAQSKSPYKIAQTLRDSLKLHADTLQMLVEELKEEYPESKALPFMLHTAGAVSAAIDDKEKAVEYFKEIVQNHPTYEEKEYVMYLLGYQYRLLNQPAQAVEVFDELKEEFPQDEWTKESTFLLLNWENFKELNTLPDSINDGVNDMEDDGMEKANQEFDKANEEIDKANEKIQEDLDKLEH